MFNNRKIIILFSLIFLFQSCKSPAIPVVSNEEPEECEEVVEGLTVKNIITYNTEGYSKDIALYKSTSPTLAVAADQNGYFVYMINTNEDGSIPIEELIDSNGNGVWDGGEFFVDLPNGEWDECEEYTDSNGNGLWDEAEEYTDSNENGFWDYAEEYTDSNCDGEWNDAEEYNDTGNGIWDDSEEYTDSNGNGLWDDDEVFTDSNENGFWDDSEEYTDSNGNDQHDSGEYFTDSNCNGSWDNALDIIIHNNDTNPYAGDDLAREVDFSSDGDAIFILDPLDLINMIGTDPDAFADPLEVPKCSGWNLYRSMAINESDDYDVILYSLLKHIEADDNATYQPYSTSIVTQKCVDYGEGSDVILDCSCTSTINNLSYYCMNISFSYPLLAISNDQLGVLVYKENDAGELEYFSSFDTPGSVNTVYSIDSLVFAGLSSYEGCYIALLDEEGQVSSNLQIAEGYSIKGIDVSDGLLALACGIKGVLLYEWFGEGINLFELGEISTEYAYSVEVYNRNTIIVGTKEGIQIINFKD